MRITSIDTCKEKNRPSLEKYIKLCTFLKRVCARDYFKGCTKKMLFKIEILYQIFLFIAYLYSYYLSNHLILYYVLGYFQFLFQFLSSIVLNFFYYLKQFHNFFNFIPKIVYLPILLILIDYVCVVFISLIILCLFFSPFVYVFYIGEKKIVIQRLINMYEFKVILIIFCYAYFSFFMVVGLIITDLVKWCFLVIVFR